MSHETESAETTIPDNSVGVEEKYDGSEKEANPEAKKKQRQYFIWIIAVMVVSAIGGAIWWLDAQGHEETEDAYVDADITTVSSRVAGTVTHVFVKDNQRVEFNQPLVQLDQREASNQVQQLQASLRQAQNKASASGAKIGQSTLSGFGQLTEASGNAKSASAELEKARAALLGVVEERKQAESKVVEEKAQLDYSKADYERYKLVFEREAVTKQQFDKVKENVRVAEAQLNGAVHAQKEAERKILQARSDILDAQAHQMRAQGEISSAQATQKQTEIDKSQYESDEASVKLAEAQLEEACLQLSFTDIKAPLPGRIGRKSVEVGQRLQAGQSLLALVQKQAWVTANFKETQIRKMRVGQEAEVTIDSIPEKKFQGKIDSFSPASGAKFSVLPPDNATGNFTKVVQRIAVKIVLDPESTSKFADRIVPGLSCVCKITFKSH